MVIRWKRRGLAGAAGVATALVLLAATACGSDEQTSASTSTTAVSQTQAWANTTCAAIASWKHSVKGAVSSVKQSPNKEQLQLAVEHTRTWTKALEDKLRSNGLPHAASGTEAKSILQTLDSQLRDGIDKIRTSADSGSGVKGSVETVSEISTTLVTMRDQVKSAGTKLRELPGGELEQAITASAACKTLREEAT